ncbi:glycoside hydrolase family 13 protein (alpha amylase) [Seiridium cupressi]
MRFHGLLTALWATAAQALSATEWQSQSIYQIITDRFSRTDGSTTASCNLSQYCGGTWQGIINQLDYIQGMGFTAIWISPIVTNILEGSGGTSYHGYWAQDITTVNSNFGTSDDLVALSDALHARGMYLMVDVVTNHMGSPNAASSVDYSIYNPFNQQSEYHTACDIDYSSETSVETCWEVTSAPSLPDLRTEDDSIRSTWNDWITPLISKYGIDGLRMDSTKHVEKPFWPGWVDASGVYNIGEVYNGDPSVFPDWLNYIDGLENYPAYYWITRAFQSTSGSISDLVNGINTLKGSMKTSTLGSFMENHDQVRFASLTSDANLIKNAIAFTILADGIPIIYYGQEQQYSGGADPNNREPLWTSGYNTNSDLYQFITTINKIRSTAISESSTYLSYQAYPTYSDSHVIAMKKADVYGIFTNAGTSSSATVPGFTASQALCDVISGTSYTADSSGSLTLTVGPLPAILVPTAYGICGTSTGGGTTTSATKTTTAPAGTSTACSSVPVTFSETVTTSYGQTIKIVGSVAALGSWDTTKAVTLSAASYTSSNPVWEATISLPPGTTISYKFINVASSGTVTWEADPNRSYTVPTSCVAAQAVVSGTWQS